MIKDGANIQAIVLKVWAEDKKGTYPPQTRRDRHTRPVYILYMCKSILKSKQFRIYFIVLNGYMNKLKTENENYFVKVAV
jgi:hypothetical protein